MTNSMMFKYRIYPSSKQKVRIINNYKVCKQAYNELLAISKDTYKFGNVSLTKFDYNNILKGKYNIHSQVIQNVSDRVHKAFKNFFRRIKDPKCKRKGFPRFKSRVNSITFPQSGFKILSDKRIRLSKIGSVPIILHRVPKGKIKTLTIKVNKANQWFAVFSYELPDVKVVHQSKDEVGIDVGLENFATLSNGEMISNPRFLIKSEKKLKLLQRRLSRKKKGSANRRKARFRVARQHINVSNQRTDFLHKLSRSLTIKYSVIAVEDLNIKCMVKNHYLAKSITDASWGAFIQMLSYKAITSGGQLLKNPKTRGSSHRCSNCGEVVDMPLSKRKFSCPECFVVLHRDHNSALNHIKDTVGLTEISTPVDDCVRPSLKAVIVEAGTITEEQTSS